MNKHGRQIKSAPKKPAKRASGWGKQTSGDSANSQPVMSIRPPSWSPSESRPLLLDCAGAGVGLATCAVGFAVAADSPRHTKPPRHCLHLKLPLIMFLFNGPIGNSLCMVTLWIDQTRYLRPRKAIVGAQPQRADRHLAVAHSLHEPTVNRGTQPPAARVYSDLNSRSLTTSSFESDAPPVPAAGELRHIRRIMKKVRNAVFGGGVGGATILTVLRRMRRTRRTFASIFYRDS